MKMRKIGVLFYSVFLLIFLGCATTKNDTIPITRGIISEVGLENTPKFQYYVSKTITLKLVEAGAATYVDDDSNSLTYGQLIRRRQTARQQIVIPGNLPGLVRSTHDTGYFNLHVAFENYEGNPTLGFSVHAGADADKHCTLIIGGDNTVYYAGDRYTVSYDKPNELPYLLIKMQESSAETLESRTASGLLLGQ